MRPEVSVFSGLGTPAGQLAELRRAARLPLVLAFVRSITRRLLATVATLPQSQQHDHFAHGMDVASWATSQPSACPPLEYLNSVSVSLVLTFVIQLACFKYVWASQDAYPASATAGYSQGLAAAIVVALADCEQSFELYAEIFAGVLLHLGLAAARHIPTGSYALAVLKIPTDEVAARVESFGGPVYVVVLNGSKACTITGNPDALTAFQQCLPPSAAHKRLPVGAPFHCSRMMGRVREDCSHSLQQVEGINADRLRRPCWSCVDGTELSSSGAQSLQAVLVQMLIEDSINWSRAVRSIIEYGGDIVDYGPGGGSGVARMSSTVATELAASSISISYFTQRHCVSGPLPQSWLAWIKSEGNSNGGSSPPSGKAQGFEFFSDRLKKATDGDSNIAFTPTVCAVIAPELEKVRVGRRLAKQRWYPEHIRENISSQAFQSLCRNVRLNFDVEVYPFQRAFVQLLALPKGLPLHRLHERFHADRGSKRERREKASLLAPLTDPVARTPFIELYERFVVEVLAPQIHSIMPCERIIFQSFPCLRVHRPGEFSIGPHCDAQYQAPDGNVNFYIPLTDRIWGTNSLFVETEPGKEDWQPLLLSYGQFQRFYGVYAAHFTAENTTDITRVSMDFRMIPGCCYEEDIERQPKDFRVGEYYSECRLGDTGVFEVKIRGFPYWRHGFPHTNR